MGGPRYNDVISGNKPHKGISKKLKLCLKCKRVHETEYQSGKQLHHEDFPTYGLERKTCNRCKRRKNDKNGK